MVPFSLSLVKSYLKPDYRSQAGFLLLEMLFAIVFTSSALIGVVMLFNQVMQHSAEPILHNQALAVARSYLSEVLAQPFCDPDDTSQPISCSDVCSAPEASRDLFDNVCDYNALNDVGVRDRNNSLVSGMDHFTVDISVTNSPTDTLGGASPIPGGDILRVDVSVTYSTSITFSINMSGYRTAYSLR
jgi:MSHA pilin protein MshD